jgi:hypothetical protein
VDDALFDSADENFASDILAVIGLGFSHAPASAHLASHAAVFFFFLREKAGSTSASSPIAPANVREPLPLEAIHCQ